MTPGRNRLEEIVAGLSDVTPGPWRPSRFGFQIVSDYPEAAWQSVVELRTIAQTYPSLENEMKSQEAIANHLARCSPDAIREIDAYVRDLEERLAKVREEAIEDVLGALTAHELYQYRPKAFTGFIEYARTNLSQTRSEK